VNKGLSVRVELSCRYFYCMCDFFKVGSVGTKGTEFKKSRIVTTSQFSSIQLSVALHGGFSSTSRRIFRQTTCTDDVAWLTLILSLLKIEDVNDFDKFHLKIVLIFYKNIKTHTFHIKIMHFQCA
jgi:hypothetical protein